MDNKQDYENWKKIMHKKIIELVEKGSIDYAVNFSLSKNLIDIPLDIYEKVAKIRGGNVQRDLRKKAGDISKEYYLFKRAIDNYKAAPDKKVVSLSDNLSKKMIKIMDKENRVTKDMVYRNLERYDISNLFYKN